MGQQRHGHVPGCHHHGHQHAGLVSCERAPHRLEAGDVAVPALETMRREVLAGPHVGSQGVLDRGGRHGLGVEAGEFND